MNLQPKPLLYLATPYTHKDPRIIEARYFNVTQMTANIISNFDVIVFSPITYSHYLAEYMSEDFDWYTFDLGILDKCDYLGVLKLKGWDISEGVQLEIDYAKDNDIPIIKFTMKNWYKVLSTKLADFTKKE